MATRRPASPIAGAIAVVTVHQLLPCSDSWCHLLAACPIASLRWREMDSNFRFRVRCKRGLRRKSPASAACRRRLSGAAGSVRDEGSVPRFRFAPELMATDGGTFPIMASTRWSKVRLF